MLARMLVDDGASLGGRERSTALRGKGRWCRAEAKIEICWHDRKRTVEMLLLSTRISIYIERSKQDHYSCSRSEGFFLLLGNIPTHTLFATGSKSMQIHASPATAAKLSEQDAALPATRNTLEENVCNVCECVCVRE